MYLYNCINTIQQQYNIHMYIYPNRRFYIYILFGFHRVSWIVNWCHLAVFENSWLALSLVRPLYWSYFFLLYVIRLFFTLAPFKILSYHWLFSNSITVSFGVIYFSSFGSSLCLLDMWTFSLLQIWEIQGNYFLT